ncbi:MAG: ParA family protein [Lachnospiraceae bacterium]|nr:ParA family protein [Lachnospiraceae bacterium]
MGRVIAISNQKGGVGKTTTSINLSACLAEKGKRILVIDIDPQANTTSGLGIDKTKIEHTTYELLMDETTIWEAMTPSVIKGLTVIPSERSLSAAEIELINASNREYVLKKEVDKVRDNYDYVIIDCPPSLSLLTVNAMTTADTVLVPIQCEYYALEGLSELVHTINLVKSRLNQDLEIEGILFTMYDSRTCLSSQVVENVKENLQVNVYNTVIPRNVRLAEAPSHGLPINLYEPKSAGAEGYRRLAQEVLNHKI